MFDSIPPGGRARAHASVAEVCAEALGITPDIFVRATNEAVRAGYHRGDAAAVAFLAVADPTYGTYARGGKHGHDATRAAIYRHCPRRQREAERRLRCAWARRGCARWCASQEAKASDPLDVLLAAEAVQGDDRETVL
jgi:hypothetical protein